MNLQLIFKWNVFIIFLYYFITVTFGGSWTLDYIACLCVFIMCVMWCSYMTIFSFLTQVQCVTQHYSLECLRVSFTDLRSVGVACQYCVNSGSEVVHVCICSHAGVMFIARPAVTQHMIHTGIHTHTRDWSHFVQNQLSQITSEVFGFDAKMMCNRLIRPIKMLVCDQTLLCLLGVCVCVCYSHFSSVLEL